MDFSPEEKLELFKKSKQEVAYKAQHFNVLIDRIELSESKTLDYDIAELPGASVMIPIDDEGNLILIKQYRHPIKKIIYELPAGKIDPGEDPQATAIRELQEEIGYFPEKIEKLCQSYPAPGYSTEILHFYLTTQLKKSKLPHDEFEAIEVVRFSLEESIQMIKDGKIVDGKTTFGILFYEKSL